MRSLSWRTLLLMLLATLLTTDTVFAGGKRFRRNKCRVVDTRDPGGPTGGSKLIRGNEIILRLKQAHCPDYDEEDVDTYEATVTVAAPTGPGFLHFRASDTPIPVPLTSDMNFDTNWTIANETSIPVDLNGDATFLTGVNDAHVIIDLYGFTTERFPVGELVNYTGDVAAPLISAGNDSVSTASAGLRGFAINGTGTQGFSMNYFGGFFRGDTATAAFFDGVGTYGGYGQSREGNMRSGIAGALNDPGGMPLARGYLGMDQGPSNWAVFAEGNYGGTGAKYFVEPHPHRADLVIRYVALEGPEAGTYFRGRGKLQNGLATIDVPEDFRLVTDPDSLTVQITPIGEMATVAVVRMALDRIVVRGSRNVAFSYMVNGVRKSHRSIVPMGPGSEYAPQSLDAKIPAHLTPVQREYLISNGTYNADGTVNLETARALGWDKSWKKEGVPIPPKAPAASDEP